MFATSSTQSRPKAGGCATRTRNNLPLVHSGQETIELRATGMPLGLMPAMRYDELGTTLSLGRKCCSTATAGRGHDSARRCSGPRRVIQLLAEARAPQPLINELCLALDRFTGAEHEQETT